MHYRKERKDSLPGPVFPAEYRVGPDVRLLLIQHSEHVHMCNWGEWQVHRVSRCWAQVCCQPNNQTRVVHTAPKKTVIVTSRYDSDNWLIYVDPFCVPLSQ